MRTKIFDSYIDFLDRENELMNGVSRNFADNNANWEKENETNEGCYNCSKSTTCKDCYICSYCNNCEDCFNCHSCDNCNGMVGLDHKFGWVIKKIQH